MLTAISLLSIGFLALAAWRDLAARTIPDALPLALALAGVALRGAGGLGAVGGSLAMAVLLFGILAALHARGWLGGGDVKLAAGVAAGLAPHAVPAFVMATGLAGGVLAGVHLILRRLPRRAAAPAPAPGLVRIWRAERWRIARRGSLPYGVAIACGGAWTMLPGSGG